MIKTHFFSLFFLMSVVLATAQNVKIVKCNTPTVNVNGKSLKPGESFNLNNTIHWDSPNQVIIIRNGDSKMIRLAAKMSDNGKSDIASAILKKSVNHFSSRAADDIAGGEYIIEDTLMIPTYLEVEGKPIVELLSETETSTVSYPVKLSEDYTYAIIKRTEIPELKDKVLKCKLWGTMDGDKFEISDVLVITPIEIALKCE